MKKPVNEQTVLAILLRRIIEQREKERINGVGTELQPTETFIPDNDSFSRFEVYDSDVPVFDPGLFVKIEDGKMAMTAFTVESVLDVCDEIDAAPEDTYLGAVKTRQLTAVEKDKIAIEREKEALRGDRIENDVKEKVGFANAFKITAEGNVLNDVVNRKWVIVGLVVFCLFSLGLLAWCGFSELAEELVKYGFGSGVVLVIYKLFSSDNLIKIIRACRGDKED